MAETTHDIETTIRLIEAKPTIDAAGNVVRWQLGVSFVRREYKTIFNFTAEAMEFDATKTPSRFTKAELLLACPIGNWKEIFRSQYESVMEAPVVTETFDAAFRVDDLSA